MRLHDEALVWFQFARLEQDMIGQTDFADVVERRAAFDELDEVLINLALESGRGAGFLGESTAIGAEPLQVQAGFRIARFDQLRQSQEKSVARRNQIAVAAAEGAL